MNYALVENNTVVNVAVFDAAPDPEVFPGLWVETADAGIGWTYDGTDFTPPEPEPEPAQDKRITRLAFRQRFTTQEKVALKLASVIDPSATQEVQAQQAMIASFLDDVDAATFIDLARQDTIDGVQAMVLFGLITPERADEVLNAPIDSIEPPL